MKRLFGTDGIRGEAGEFPLDGVTVRSFGGALAEVLSRRLAHPARIVIGRDTRESGTWLRDAVAAGLSRHGGSAVDAGVITTPGLALLARGEDFDAGVMISASHNPFRDNGLKVFAHDGVKLSDDIEREIESLILDREVPDPGDGDGEIEDDPALVGHYIRHLESVVEYPRPFAGLRVLLDCANGAASEIAPAIFRRYGAAVETIGCEPDGRNINLDCGSLHLELLSREVREGGFDLGIAFDGDADRALAVDRRGRVADGDAILWIAARELNRRGALRGQTVVATIMTNLWLEVRLREQGVRLLRTPVGDKYVLERMVLEDAVLGGEQSGHIIFRDRGTTGDGIVTGLLLLESLRQGGQTLDSVLDGIEPFPQVLLNVPVRQKPDLREHPVISPAVADLERRMDGLGRVVLRYSGTESLARVMVEGHDPELVQRFAAELAALIRTELG